MNRNKIHTTLIASLLFSLLPFISTAQSNFAANSVLADGEWYKIRVNETGMQQLTYDQLEAAGIDVSEINPATIRLFGNGTGMLPERNSLPRHDDLIENAIYVEGAEDGSFDSGDYILFFAESGFIWEFNPFQLRFEHQVDYYDDYTYYFLTYNNGEGKRIGFLPSDTSQADLHVDKFTDYLAYENEEVSLTRSGKRWYGEVFNSVLERKFDFELTDIVPTSPVYITMAYAVRANDENSFKVYANDNLIGDVSLPSLNLGGMRYAHSDHKNYTFYSSSETLQMKMKYEPGNPYSYAWLDYFEINYLRKLHLRDGQLFFRTVNNIGDGMISRFAISGINENARVWEVSDRFNIAEVETELTADSCFYTLSTDSLREFVAWDGSSFNQPDILKRIENQNLHALQPVDYIVVTPPEFETYAHQMGQLHEQYDGLDYHVVTTDELYNEFSSGSQDPTAIRDFARMLYERGKDQGLPRYMLLFGDGSYDPKDRTGIYPNLIPTFQSEESFLYTSSFVTDDYYALLDPGEGHNAYGVMDMGVGRFPVNDEQQAVNAVKKISHYMENYTKVMGNWRNEIIFVADDEDGNLHFSHAEKLSRIVDTSYRQYHSNKIYLDSYQQVSVAGGKRYPDVNEAIDNAVENGALVVNYTGHGGELGWSEESVLNIPTINSWDNYDKMPLFMTATCEFSRFDNPELISAGELIFLNPKGGGIGLFTTTRLAFAQANFYLNRAFYLNAFKPINGEMPRLGDIFMKTKSHYSEHVLNFTILGDPALRLAYPAMDVQTTAIRDAGSLESADTLSSLGAFIIEGQITDPDGDPVENFYGLIYPKIYDKPKEITTLGNDQASPPRTFEVQKDVIFSGRATVNQGVFSFEALLPVDMDLNYGEGRIIYYAKDTSSVMDANGFYDVMVGGFNQNAQADLTGPAIDLYMNNPGFQNGDYTNTDPLLIAHFFDESGVNFYGNGIGHDIVATLDGDYSNSIILNDHYEAGKDNYKNGALAFKLNDLSEGPHTLEVKAWDLYNNSSVATIDFVVSGGSGFNIAELSNYPNPFYDQTRFTFNTATGNGVEEVEIKIFALNGEFVKNIIKPVNDDPGMTTIVWNGTGDRGAKLPGGTYIYNVILRNDLGYSTQASGKMVLIR